MSDQLKQELKDNLAQARLRLRTLLMRLNEEQWHAQVYHDDEPWAVIDLVRHMVDAERGLVAPVVRNADQKSLTEINLEIRSLVEKARAGKLMPDDVTGGTFTLTNLGAVGGGWGFGTPIINQPQSAILGTGSITDRAVVRDGQIVARPVMTYSLTFDHRAIDGAPAAKFAARVTELLENAIRHTGKGKTVGVAAEAVEKGGKQHVRIVVRNDGEGIEARYKGRLFDPFFSLRPGGTGLGLAIVSQIINNHKGTIRETGEAGKYAQFEIELPARPFEEGADEGPRD